MGRVRWHTILVVVLTVGLLWLFFRNINLREAWVTMTHADVRYLVLALLSLVATYLVRTWRWQALLQPIGNAPFSTAFRCTVIGFAATAVLPARVGEVLRPYLLAKREGLKATSTFATVIVERLLDVCTVFLLFAVALPYAGAKVDSGIKWAGALAATAAVTALVILFVLAGHPERLRGWAEQVVGKLPGKAAGKVGHFVQTFVEGLKVMRSPAHFGVAVAWSIPVWLTIALGIWFTSQALGLTFSFLGSFLVMGALSVGVSAPTPGGAGGFHLMYKIAVTQFFGADPAVAGAAAIILHLISFGPVTIAGLLLMWHDGLTIASLKRMKDEAPQ